MRQDIDMERLLIWTYQSERAHANYRRGGGLYGAERDAAGMATQRVSFDGIAAIERSAILGTHVDSSRSSVSDLNSDAEVVHEAVRSLNPMEAGKVVVQARLGERPDWMEDAKHTLGPARVREDGSPVTVNRHCVPFYTPIREVVTPGMIELARAEYILWWDAVSQVMAMVKDNLDGFTVTGFTAIRTPWEKGAENCEAIAAA